jgi:hypothetical protein
MKHAKYIGLRTLALGAGLLLASAGANAQTRTWVSGVGDDVNPCSRTAPCKTFAGAISKTATNGIIHVLDPGGFGAVTITKSITIDGHGLMGSITTSLGGSGIIVNAPAGSVVTLRNLTIYGLGTGQNGIRFLAGGALHVENCVINGFKNPGGLGILVNPTTGVLRLFVRHSRITNNGSLTDGGGIKVVPTGVSTFVFTTIHDSNISGNNGWGIKSQDRTFTTISRTQIDGNLKSGISALSTAAATDVVVHDSVLSDNGSNGSASEAAVLSTGGSAIVHLSQNILTQNVMALRRVSGGHIFTFSDNKATSNTDNGTTDGNELKL